MNKQSLPTVNEIVNTLKRSGLPIILIEGSDDAYIYRHLQSNLNANLISLQPCGGRTNLFTIHDRKSEFSDKNVIFIADKDSFVIDGIPENRSDIIFTSGYCIENDIYTGSSISNFLDPEDISDHSLLRAIIGKWFAYEVEKYLKIKQENGVASLSVGAHINSISPQGSNSICANFANDIGYVEPSGHILNTVISQYDLNVRGKQLFQMLSRFLSKKGRFSTFSDKNLIEVALKQGNNIFLDDMISSINDRIAS